MTTVYLDIETLPTNFTSVIEDFAKTIKGEFVGKV